jgi:propane monooxygenase small subunit
MRSVRNGDIITQAVSHVAQLEWEWVRNWTAELLRFVLTDSEHGEANRAVLDGWLADWMPLAEDAAVGLEPVFDQLPAGISFDDARANVQIDVDELLAECELTEAAPAGGAA